MNGNKIILINKIHMTFSDKYRNHFGLLSLLWKIMVTECSSGKTPKMPFGVNSTTELKKYNKIPLLSDVVVIFLGGATVAFSEQYTVLLVVSCIHKKWHFFHVACNVPLNISLDKYGQLACTAVLLLCHVCNGSMYRLIGLSEGPEFQCHYIILIDVLCVHTPIRTSSACACTNHQVKK
jgi:hypothetical protein